VVEKVLVVDDTGYSRHLVMNMVQSLGYEAVDAENGVAGLDKLKQESFGTVITDLLMPDMNGIEFYEHAKEIDGNAGADSQPFRCPPFILISAVSDNLGAMAEEAKQKGFAEILVKPVDRVRLEESLKNTFESLAADSEGMDLEGNLGSGGENITIQGILAFLEEQHPGAREKIIALSSGKDVGASSQESE